MQSGPLSLPLCRSLSFVNHFVIVVPLPLSPPGVPARWLSLSCRDEQVLHLKVARIERLIHAKWIKVTNSPLHFIPKRGQRGGGAHAISIWIYQTRRWRRRFRINKTVFQTASFITPLVHSLFQVCFVRVCGHPYAAPNWQTFPVGR